jgi:uncharacterized membrane protein YciS (DUF1049 family)
MQKFFDSFAPFLALGFAIAIFFALLFVLFQILVWGTLIGVIAWGAFFIKSKLFPEKRPKKMKKKYGRIIEHDDVF